ncbi:GEVED domain-containing protein [Flavobacterium silvaticum]|uniref:T9SS type A sorting domain-containing protein n=1 Tax=Flavobacterium silvaticum TaxID=1852020 RepID=A0A972FV63_9FLAO|nr:GEVED domain-containing protein [Flavobacterium silvaticum]NMH29123.1 T9SS type A sorting domain-containing protein [Flavobacterium silvaticum]
MTKKLLAFLFLFCVSEGFCQVASQYQFLASTEAYTQVGGISSTVEGDDSSQEITLTGFNFPYAGTTYSLFSISTNGLIRLGQAMNGAAFNNDYFNTDDQAPAIAVFWDDHNRNTGTISYTVTGVAPNRKLDIGWDNIVVSSGGGVNGNVGSFKVRLSETTGVIEMWYGTITTADPSSASVGINDAGSYLSVIPGTTPTVSSTVSTMITSGANLTGRKFTFTPPAPCSGQPDGGTTVASANPVCLGVPVTLSVEGNTASIGISYLWQSSENGVDYADLTGETSNLYTTFQFADTYYRCKISCGSQFAFSEPIQVEMNAAANCYCQPTYDNGKTDGDLISNIVIPGTTLSNNTGTEPINPYYTYFTGQPNYTAELNVGGNYTLQVTVGSYGQQHHTAWIDYNDDGFFAEEERLGGVDDVDSFQTGSLNFTVSCDAMPGVHRMRVRDAWNTDSFSIDPCGNYGYGETEDYDITILEQVGCAAPTGLGVSAFSSTSAILVWAAGCGQTQWNVVLLPAGAAFSEEDAMSDVNSSLLINDLEPATSYDFYVQGMCNGDVWSDYSAVFTFTTAPAAVANDDCSTAFPLEVGATFAEFAVTATNEGATKTIGEPNVSCAQFNFGGDVWFSAEVPASGSITIQTQSAEGSDLSDTGMAVYTGTCGGGLISLGCNDDSGILGMEGFSSLTFAGLTPGTLLHVRVWEYANDVVGTFRVGAFDPTLGTADAVQQLFSVTPNPVKNILSLQTSEPIDSVEIFNTLGQKVTAHFTPDWHSADTASLSAGVYLLRIKSGSQYITKRFIKE